MPPSTNTRAPARGRDAGSASHCAGVSALHTAVRASRPTSPSASGATSETLETSETSETSEISRTSAASASVASASVASATSPTSPAGFPASGAGAVRRASGRDVSPRSVTLIRPASSHTSISMRSAAGLPASPRDAEASAASRGDGRSHAHAASPQPPRISTVSSANGRYGVPRGAPPARLRRPIAACSTASIRPGCKVNGRAARASAAGRRTRASTPAGPTAHVSRQRWLGP
ncbi:hypothetical protein X948_5169 [Burkholderia pseudomallei MSHR5608]|nr:hypothetical protein X948_5169 [Burkholderia pseudomallei MSHR5608]